MQGKTAGRGEGGVGERWTKQTSPHPLQNNKNWEKNKSQQQVKSIWSFKKREGVRRRSRTERLWSSMAGHKGGPSKHNQL